MNQITLDSSAIVKIKDLLALEDVIGLKLRIYVSGGGCSGFQYGFTFDDNQNEDDFVIDQDEVSLLVDAHSMQYLTGSVISYDTSLMTSGFNIKNPAATSTCGCGSSFSA
ncbi:iron-sulfur cluster insertion protein ErpA [Gammaproteobacteria bacterium]